MAFQEKNTLIFGRHPIVDALQSGAQLDKIFLQQGVTGDFEKEVRKLCREHDVPLQYVPKERMNKLVKGNHQGIVGYLALLDYARLDNVVPGIFETGETPLINTVTSNLGGNVDPRQVQELPVIINGEIEARKRMNLSLSCDHRVVDGWDAASFLQAMKGLIENPIRLLSA